MSFCRDAALMSMRKVIKDKSPEEIKLLSKNDLEKPVTMDDFNEGNFLRGIVNCQGVGLDLLSSSVRLTWTTVSITFFLHQLEYFFLQNLFAIYGFH